MLERPQQKYSALVAPAKTTAHTAIVPHAGGMAMVEVLCTRCRLLVLICAHFGTCLLFVLYFVDLLHFKC